jgi:hypothetical protein
MMRTRSAFGNRKQSRAEKRGPPELFGVEI